MLFHLSINAHDPKKVAESLAQIMNGKCLRFPVVDNAYIALADDGLGTAVEVYPSNIALKKGDDNNPVKFVKQTPELGTAIHFAIQTKLSKGDIFALAKENGWRCLLCDRGPFFKVIEFWLENERLVEIITEDLKENIVKAHHSSFWEAALDSDIDHSSHH